MNLNEKLRQLRENEKLSQEKTAEIFKVSRQAYAKWEKGEALPSLSNIIAISSFYKISLDIRLKDDTCLPLIQKKEKLIKDELLEFLVEAKKNTYAIKQNQINSTRENSVDYEYKNGNFKYNDSYFGAIKFSGQEIVEKNNTPIWSMNYFGIVIGENFSSEFLLNALFNTPKDKPFRGPELFQERDYTYNNKIYGEHTKFSGIETIYYKNTEIYNLIYHGGALI